MSGVRHIKVPEDDDGQRLDRWLKKTVDNLPFGLSQKLIRKGQIRVDGKRVKPDTRLTAGQDIRIPPLDDSAPAKTPKSQITPEDEDFIKSLIIYEDDQVIALNKPPGLAVQGGSNTRRHIDGMLAALARNDVSPRLVHRLDKDTSGVLLLARSAESARKLGKSFKSREVRKIYWALVSPPPPVPEGQIKAPLSKSVGAQKEKMVIDEEEGKFALTDYRMLERAGDKAAFMAFWPRTGRTHQIRVHADILGAPVVGDRKYGGAEARIDGLDHPNKLHLHARRVILPHPGRKAPLDISADLPPELAGTWNALGFETNLKDDPFADI